MTQPTVPPHILSMYANHAADREQHATKVQAASRATASTITDPELDQLYAEVDRLTAELTDYDQRVQQLTRERDGIYRMYLTGMGDLGRALDRLDRVREVADKLADGTEAGFRAALAIREALDQPAPAATQATDG